MWNCSTRPRRTANSTSRPYQSMDALLPPHGHHHPPTYPPIQPSNHPTHQRPIRPFRHAITSINRHSALSAKLLTSRHQSTCHYQLHPTFIIWASPAAMRDGSSSFQLVLVLTRPFAFLLSCRRKWLTQQRPILNVVRNISLTGLSEYCNRTSIYQRTRPWANTTVLRTSTILNGGRMSAGIAGVKAEQMSSN